MTDVAKLLRMHWRVAIGALGRLDDDSHSLAVAKGRFYMLEQLAKDLGISLEEPRCVACNRPGADASLGGFHVCASSFECQLHSVERYRAILELGKKS